MKALLFTQLQEMVWTEVPDPVLDSSHSVLVRMGAVGICGSDIQGYLGLTGRRIPPMIMGHEMAGLVEKTIGPTSFRKGQKVIVMPFVNCGLCENCRSGKTNFCINPKEYYGILSDNGGMAEYLAIDEYHLIPIPDYVDLKVAALAEPLAVAYGGVEKIDIKDSKPILIIGAGTIGLFVLSILKSLGKENVFVCDMNQRRLSIAKKLGAEHVKQLGFEDDDTWMQICTHNNGFNYIIDAVGVSATYTLSVKWASRGASLVWIGNASKMVSIPIPDLIMRELTIHGSFIYNDETFRKSIELLVNESERFAQIIELVAPMSTGADVFKRLAIEKQDIIKAILVRE